MDKIEQWEISTWQEDWGSPKAEFETLKQVSRALLEQNPSLDLRLNSVEEGYLFVDVFNQGEPVGDFTIVENRPLKLVLNLESGDEIYFSQATDSIERLNSIR